MELYFDESGNTGTNYLDSRQPYFVYGGWLIKAEKTDEICKRIRQIFSRSKATELKAKNVTYDKMKELFHAMIFECGALPVFGVADKKYMVAAKITETFFDHEYNPNVNGYLTFKTELKKALADSISCNDNLLIEFSKIIHDGTMELETMREIKEMLANHFQKEKLLDVQKTIIELSDSNLQEMIEEFEVISRKGTEKKWLTLVEPILIDRILSIDQYSQMVGTDVKLYVDELSGFRDVFKELSEILDKRTIIKNVKFIKQCQSDENLLIQAADMLCGFINRTFINKELSMKDETVNEIWQDFIFIGNELEKIGIKIWDYYAHSEFEYEILYLAGYTGEKMKSDCKKTIERDFSLAINKNRR